MKIKHSDYLKYEIPSGWVVDESDDECISIYDNDGKGALTLSFYTIMELYNNSIDEHISVMAKDFIDKNHVELKDSIFIIDGTKKDKTVLYGTGKTEDGWFIKLWIAAKFPKAILATYHSPKKTSEVKIVDKIIDSFKFIF